MKNSDDKKPPHQAEAAPPVSAIEALGRNLMYQFLHAVGGTDPAATGNATDMAKALVEKAKTGDVKAIRLAVDVIQTAAGFNGATTINAKHITHNDNRGATFVSELRMQVVAVMRSVGPVTPDALARHLGVVKDRLGPVLDHEWFEERSGAYCLSDKATVESGNNGG